MITSSRCCALQTEENKNLIDQCEAPKSKWNPKRNPLAWTALEPSKLIRRNGSRVELARVGTHTGRVLRVRREGTQFTADVAFAGDAAAGLTPWEQVTTTRRVRMASVHN